MARRAFLLALVLLFGAGSVPASPTGTRTSTVRGVTLAVTPAFFDPATGTWEFAVAFHSTGPRLDDDMVQSATLVAGSAILRPTAWEGQPPTRTHHRVGILRFTALEPAPDEIELRVQRRAEAKPRIFRWNFGSWYAVRDPQRR